MAKCKYDANTFPLLAESYARDGMIDKEIAAKLGISCAAFYKYQNDFPEFMEAVKRGKRPVDVMVENALLRKAVGWTYDEIHTIARVKGEESKERIVKTVKKEVQPDTTAQIFWLKNRMPDKWRDKQEVNHSGNISWNFDKDDEAL